MLAFIICCSLLALMAQNHVPYLSLLTTPVGLGFSLSLMAISLVAGYFKKVPSLVWHDGFATASLLVWYGYWQPQFDPDAPMFVFYPLYFALFSAMVTLALIQKAQNFDAESVKYLRSLHKMLRFDINAAVLFVILGILITRHYALYMMAITFFIVRHTIIVCLEAIDQQK